MTMWTLAGPHTVTVTATNKHTFTEVSVVQVNSRNLKGLQCMNCYRVFVGRARDSADEHVCT